MRQLWVKVPAGEGGQVLELAKKHDAKNLIQFSAHDSEGRHDIVILNVSNRSVSDIFEALDSRDAVQITLYPQDVYPLSPPDSQVPEQITHVTQRSPVEVWLNGLQSIGSWKGFLSYALAASVIVWIGLYTNTVYLLVAAMLVAPFAGPAMNFALATATGDQKLLWRNLVRYFAALALTIVMTGLLSLLFQQRAPTTTMISISEVSAVAVLLPLAAGAVGALNLSQPTNSSLVPGTAIGILVAASLAPPAGLVGMAGAVGRWDLARNGVFLLLLQLFAINLGGALVFRAYQLTPHGARFQRGRPVLFTLSVVGTLALLAGMLAWQFWSQPDLQRSTRAQRAVATAQQVIGDYPAAGLVEVNMRFTRPSEMDNNLLLGVIYVERDPQSGLAAEQIRQDLTRLLQQALLEEYQVRPLITVTVLEPPP